MGKVGKAIIGVGLIVSGALVGVFTGQWNIAIAMMSSGAGMLLQPKIPSVGADLQDRQGMILNNRTGALQRLPVAYGTVKIAGVVCDLRVDDRSTSRKRLVAVVAFCHGSQNLAGITAIDETWFDDRLAINSSGVVQSPFSAIAEGSTKHLEYGYHLGTSTQTVDSRLAALFPGDWSATAQGRGVAYARYELWYNTDIYPNGVPNIQVKLRGNAVYDPRSATTAFSDNPALCIRDYLTSTIYGLGVPVADLDEQSFIDGANYCDELVSIPTGSQKRFTLNGWVDTSRSVEQNLAELCTACRGQVLCEGRKWRLVIRRERSVSGYKINADNTLAGTWQYILPGADGAPNIVRASFVDPSANYGVNTVEWPDPSMANPYLTDDNGFEQILEIDLPYTNNRLGAQQIAMTLLKEARAAVGVACTLKESSLKTRVGELVQVTYESPGWADKEFDLTALTLLQDGSVQAILTEYDPAVYDLDAQPAEPIVSNTNLPDPFSLAAPTNLLLTVIDQALQTNDGRYIPRIKVTWDKVADPFVSFYEVQAKKTTETQWDTYGRPPEDADALLFIAPVVDDSWDVRISAVNRLGKRSTWVSATVLVVTDDPRPQVTSITLTQTHSDAHNDVHSDVAHSDAAHSDAHTDAAHSDVHMDTHTDHSDTTHGDGHSDIHGDGDLHGDFHSDHSDTNHADTAHGDAHDDTAHTDSHSDAAHGDSVHGDGHNDAHGDGQHGVGVAIQADTDSASVRVVARKGGPNLLSDGGAESGVLGSQAAGWTSSSGNNLVVANDSVKLGTYALKFSNPTAANSVSYQDVAVVAGVVYRLHGWIAVSALPAADAGAGAILSVTAQTGISAFTIVSKTGYDANATKPDVGVAADGVSHAYQYVECVFIPTGTDGTVRVACNLGYGGTQSGTAWFDDVWLQRVYLAGSLPDEVDVRTQTPVNGRNIVVDLIDVATGAQMTLDPGEVADISALAYSDVNGGGVEGPLARGRASSFPVAPVGTDKWVPSE